MEHAGFRRMMWRTSSLRARLSLLLCGITIATLVLCIAALFLYARDQLEDEQQPRIAAAREVVAAVNYTLRNVQEPRRVLDGLVRGLEQAHHMRFEDAAVDPRQAERTAQAELAGGAPGWFVRLLKLPELTVRFPVVVDGQRAGDMVLRLDIAADVAEKWDIFMGLIVIAGGLALAAILLASRLISVTLRPLHDIAGALQKLQAGDYRVRLRCEGTPEIVAGCHHVNNLAETLEALTAEKAELLRRLVVLQDDERREIARELHDELGPLLFAIRANTTGLVQPGDGTDADAARSKLLGAVEALQQTNRRILNRLRPMHVQELGLTRSIEGLARDCERQSTGLEVTTSIDADVGRLDVTVAETIYRLAQEALTNVMRHAGASEAELTVRLDGGQVHVEVSDDGAGFQAPLVLGRGLTGMRERVRALDGRFEMLRSGRRTVVRCMLPLAPAARGRAGSEMLAG
jgi:signal transduction histidine kinase